MLKNKQIILIYDVMEEINKEKLIEFICGLQQEDGSFTGDSWGLVFHLLFFAIKFFKIEFNFFLNNR